MNFQIETVSHCDLTCGECPNWMMKRSRRIMSRDVWDTIITKYVIPYKHVNAHLNPPTLLPHKDGEPLLNKHLDEYLAFASSKVPDINIDIYTHGLLLPKRPGFIDFLGTLPNKVRMLVSFHFHNHDGTINDYTATNAFFRDLFSRPTPGNIEFIFASHLIKPMTEERLNEWKASWSDLFHRVTVHANTHINPWAGLMEDVATCHFPNMCPYYHFDHMFFGASGNVIACCLDLEEEIVFGNVMTDDPANMVGTVEAFYAAQGRSENIRNVCRNCYGLSPREDLIQVGGMA